LCTCEDGAWAWPGACCPKLHLHKVSECSENNSGQVLVAHICNPKSLSSNPNTTTSNNNFNTAMHFNKMEIILIQYKF
jgi:hypothetical protein